MKLIRCCATAGLPAARHAATSAARNEASAERTGRNVTDGERMNDPRMSGWTPQEAKLACPRNQSPVRRGARALAALLLVSLAGCGALGLGAKDDGPPGSLGSVRGFLGGAVADEPRAALIARDMLSAGGSAADAAVAGAFALVAGAPANVPLGGAGMCLVATGSGRVRTVEMLPFPAVAARPDSTVATPGLPRGLFALHARYGRLRWEQVLSPAENLARIGAPASRATSIELARHWDVASADPRLAALFGREGRPIAEGTPFLQPPLAAVLGVLRQRGPGELHSGAFGRQVVAAMRAAGLDLRIEDMAAGVPQFGPSFRVGEGVDLFVGATPAIGALATGQIYSALEARWRATPPDARPALLASTAAAASRDRQGWVGADLANTQPLGEAMAPARLQALAGAGGEWAAEPDVPAGAGIAVVDRNGMAVACSFTGYRPFGIGRMPEGVDMLFAPAPDGAAASPRWLAAAIGLRERRDVVFAGAASGGAAAPLALAQTALDTLADALPLDRALAASRAVPPGTADGIARVQAIVCRDGLVDAPQSCRVEADPRGAGLGIGTQ